MAERHPVTYPITVDTIGALIDLDGRACLSCPGCGKSSDIDLHKVADKVGRDWAFIDARWPVRCRCGNRQVESRIAPKPR